MQPGDGIAFDFSDNALGASKLIGCLEHANDNTTQALEDLAGKFDMPTVKYI